MDSSIPQKRCVDCKQDYPATPQFFPIDRHAPTGLRSECRQCRSLRNRTRYAERLQRYNAVYAESHREKHRAYDLQYHQEHLEKKRQYHKLHPEQHRAKVRNYRARQRSADGTHTVQDVKKQYERQKGQCYWCKKKVGSIYHVDHAIPIIKGGSNDASNIVIACPTCNLSKGGKLPHEWSQGGRLL